MRTRDETPPHQTELRVALYARPVEGGIRRLSSTGSVFLVALLLASLLGMAVAGPASAEQTRAYTGLSFGPDGAGGSEIFGNVQSVAVDQASGDVFVYDIAEGGQSQGKLYKFSAAGVPIDFPASGENSIAIPAAITEPGAEQVAIAPLSSAGGTAGNIYVANNSAVEVYSPSGGELGTIGEGETCGVAVDPDGQVFIGSFGETIREYKPSTKLGDYEEIGEGTVAVNLCNVAADGAGNVYASNYAGEETAKLEGLADPSPDLIAPGGATLTVDPVTDDLYLDQGNHVSAYESTAAPAYEFGSGRLTGSYGLAVRSSTDRVYASDGDSGMVKVFGPPLAYPTTESATDVGAGSALLHGTVRPGGRPFTGCKFEYGLDGSAGFTDAGNCEPEASEIPAESSSYPVTLALDDLHPDSDYKFRLVVTNSAGTIEGETLTFSTVGPPRITEILSRASADSATLEATIDPRGADSSYAIERGGPGGGYGTIAAAGTVTASQGPTRVVAQLEALSPASTYHFRIVAGNAVGGSTTSPDQRVETLNSCGFTDGRCLELVSRPNKGPLAGPGRKLVFGGEIQFIAAPGGSALAYDVQSGYPDTTAGAAGVAYLARRGGGGWSSEQLGPPSFVPPINRADGAQNNTFVGLSDDLSCGAIASNAPLTPEAPAAVVEAGGYNLFLGDYVAGGYQLVTNLSPANPDSLTAFFEIIAASPDCRRVVFRSEYRYPGVAASGGRYQLYEWDRGSLRAVGLIPGPGGAGDPVLVRSVPGSMEGPGSEVGADPTAPDYWRAVSADGSRTIFTALSQFGADSGQRSIFSRDTSAPGIVSGTVAATDISQSETATPNDGNSRYWIASTDGRRIFFTARYGIAANGSSSGASRCLNAPFGGLSEGSGEGCDLYEYDAEAPEGERLTDLSADSTDDNGAGVVGVLDASEDGSYIYFASRGRLGGAGATEAQNLAAGTYNVYLAHAGAIHYVHTLGEIEALGEVGKGSNAPVGTRLTSWTSRATPDGTSFVFESSVGTPGGVPMVYLFSAAEGADVCVSCRRDGRPPDTKVALTPLLDAIETHPVFPNTQPTILTGNGRLYFYSLDPLAPGAVEGQRNLYQWEHGQVSLIASEPPGVPRDHGRAFAGFFGGASADGADVYFGTPRRLLDGAEEGWNVYDARVGGGFPEPPGPSPCDSSTEGACNPGSASSPASAAPAASNFVGPGNLSAKKRHRHRGGRHGRRKHQGRHGRHGGRRHHERHRRRGGRPGMTSVNDRRGNVDRGDGK